MMRSQVLTAALLALATLPSVAAEAATVSPVVNYHLLVSDSHLTIHKDGSYTLLVHRVVEPLNATGVQSQSQVNIAYPGNFAKLSIISAYTQAANGSHIPVAPSGIFKQSTPGAIKAPFLSDGVNESVIFPAVAPGDTIHITYAIRYSHPYLPGIYALDAVLDPAIFVKSAQISMKSDDPGAGKIVKSRMGVGWQADTDGYSGSLQQVAVPPLGTPTASQYAGVAVLSTAASWKTLADAYNHLAEPATTITPAVQSAAKQAAGGAQGEAAVDKIFHWVQSNIHHVSINYQDAGFAPLPASATLTRGVADSNSEATLLCAMLKAVGVDAVPALISQTTRFKELPGVDPFAFDHVIVYLPAQHRFLDPSDRYASVNALPLADAGRPVLITGADPKMMRTPTPATAIPLVTEVDDLTLAGQALRGAETVTTSGYVAQDQRQAIAGLEGRRLLRMVRDNFYTEGAMGSLSELALRDREVLDKPFAMRMMVDMEGNVLPGKYLSVALPTMPLISATLSPFASTVQRQTPSLVKPNHLEFVLHLQIPQGYKPVYLPAAKSLKTAIGRYDVRYTFAGGVFTEDAQLLFPEFLISTADFPQLRKLAALALENNNEALLLEKSA